MYKLLKPPKEEKKKNHSYVGKVTQRHQRRLIQFLSAFVTNYADILTDVAKTKKNHHSKPAALSAALKSSSLFRT